MFSDIARIVCERHLSIGADGLMIVEPAQHKADYRMLYYNSDGSLGEMCGNGARCIGRYGYETGLAGPIQRIETTAGIVISQRLSTEMYKVRLNSPTTMDLNRPIKTEGLRFLCSYVELGNPGLPHAVIPIGELKKYPEDKLRELGRKIRYNPTFPKGANVNFYEVIGQDHVYEKTYERGVEDFTYACGTGTGSVVAVLERQGLVSGNHVRVDMAGGTLYVDIKKSNGFNEFCEIFLTGPTNIVAKGDLLDHNLRFSKPDIPG